MSKKFHLFWCSFWFLASLVGGSISYAHDIDVDLTVHRRCDPIYKPEDCRIINSENLDFKDRLASSTGINMERSATLPRFSSRRIVFSMGRMRMQASSVQAPTNTAGDVAAPPDTGNQQAQTGQGFSPEQGQTQAAAVQPQGVNIKNPGKGITTVGGMMYGDDEPELQKIAVEGQPSRGTLQDQMPTQAALNSNNRHDTGSGPGGDGGGNRGPAAATGGGMNPAAFGFENNSAPASTGGGGGYGDLGALAAALGNGVMGAINAVFDSGNSGPKHAGVFGRHTGAGGVGANANGKNQAAQVAQADRLRDLLKDRYGRYISSRKGLEFGAANTKPFQGMCGHYSAYADQHGIPTYAEIKCEGD